MRKFLILMILILSCTKNDESIIPQVYSYQYSEREIELFDVINAYRNNIGLNELQPNQHISYVCYEHNIYMIENNVVNHDYFQQRVNNLQNTLGAVRVGENIAYNYQNPSSTLNAWLNSPGHKRNIEGDYTDFGLSITRSSNQRNYITLILISR
jgi:uncharacterized protein YkwD